MVITDPIPAGVPLTAGAGGPGVFNTNDVLVMKTLVCKYMCKKKSGNFNREEFFRAILDGEFSLGGAFKEGLEKDKMNGYPEFNELVDYCLNSLVRNELIKEVRVKEPNHSEYLGTQRLDAFCSDILKFEMLDVEGFVKAVTEGEKRFVTIRVLRQLLTCCRD